MQITQLPLARVRDGTGLRRAGIRRADVCCAGIHRAGLRRVGGGAGASSASLSDCTPAAAPSRAVAEKVVGPSGAAEPASATSAAQGEAWSCEANAAASGGEARPCETNAIASVCEARPCETGAVSSAGEAAEIRIAAADLSRAKFAKSAKWFWNCTAVVLIWYNTHYPAWCRGKLKGQKEHELLH